MSFMLRYCGKNTTFIQRGIDKHRASHHTELCVLLSLAAACFSKTLPLWVEILGVMLFSQVGRYLKTPRYPIWLVCSESHFSVLFALEEGVLTSHDREQAFDLYYYDGLANQQEEIRLTVGT